MITEFKEFPTQRTQVIMKEMKPYDIGTIVQSRDPKYKGVIVMRTPSEDRPQIIMLSHPFSCWDIGFPDNLVELFPPGTTLSFKII